MAPHVRFGVSRIGEAERSAAFAFAEALAVTLRRTIRVCFLPDHDQLLEGILVGGIDFAWMPPLVQARAVDRGALLVAVCERRGALTYRSALLVRADSSCRNLAELRGARAAWTDPSSASGHLFPRLDLIAEGIDPVNDLAAEQFVGTASAACAAVAAGQADVCACYVGTNAGASHERALADVAKSVGEVARALRVIHVTEAIPPDGFVIASPVDGWMQAALRDALLYLHTTEPGAEALRRLCQADRLVAVDRQLQRLLATYRVRIGA